MQFSNILVVAWCKKHGVTVDATIRPALWQYVDGVLSYWSVPGCPEPTLDDLAKLLPAVEQEQAAATAAAEQARINGLAWKYGGLVGALSAYLARVGWSIPCEAAEVTADLLQRDLGGQLTPDQKDAKANVADTYFALSGAGLSNEDIAAVWEKVKP